MPGQTIEEAIEFLRSLSKRVFTAYTDHQELTNQLNEISPDGKNTLWNTYKDASGPIKGVRRDVGNMLKDGQIVIDNLTRMIGAARQESPNSFSRMYKEWYNILYPFLLSDYRDGIAQAIATIRGIVLAFIPNPGQVTFVAFDFSGERETGSTRFWLAFYNSTHPNQRSAQQLFLDIVNGEVSYSLYNREKNAHKDKVIVERNADFDVQRFMEHFLSNAPAILQDNYFARDRVLPLYKGESVYKISMGPDPIDQDSFDFFLEEKLIIVHGDTKPKGRAVQTQGELFSDEISIGDYFYLCRGNTGLMLIGKITSPAEDVSHEAWVDDGWLQRRYEIVQQASNTNSYTGRQKWWTPNDNSTCIRIPDEELVLANQVLFSPFFSAIFQQTEDAPPPSLIAQNTNRAMNELNTILFGPPGTGKTYTTIEKAVRIANKDFSFRNENDAAKTRQQIKAEYDRIKDEGRIQFITFHQSSNYEDFVEGIKPELEKDRQDNAPTGSRDISYNLESGIFKKAAALAAYQCYLKWSEGRIEDKGTNIPFDDLYDAFTEWLDTQIQRGHYPEFPMITGKKVKVIRINRNDSIVTQSLTAVRRREEPPKTKENIHKLYDRFFGPEQITSLDQIKDVVQIQPGISGFYAIFKGLKDFEKNQNKITITEEEKDVPLSMDDIVKNFEAGVYDIAVRSKASEAKPVVLIIDEINRGNISAIFGELITLLEPDKRMGAPEALSVTLTYSKMDFYVPLNLYLIGTMNTADRGVEALDTALRRRFQFEFMPAKPELLANADGGELMIETIPLGTLLQKINERIAYLTDEDHQIGHAWLMSVKTTDDLKAVFKKSIIPLLKEYFYNDFGKIRLVLGDGFVKKRADKTGRPGFAVNDEGFFLEKTMYHISDPGESFDIIAALRQTLTDA